MSEAALRKALRSAFFVTYRSAPSWRALSMSSALAEEVKMTVEMRRSHSDRFISAKTSKPSTRGRFTSMTTRSGLGASR